MSTTFLDEVARAPRARRVRVSDVPDYPELVRCRVTETVDMRNAGRSPVNSMMKDGWYKPAADSPMLELSTDGNSFWMYKLRTEADADKNRNNDRAKREEGFRVEHEIVKESSQTEDTTIKGTEMIDELKRKPKKAEGAGSDDNG